MKKLFWFLVGLLAALIIGATTANAAAPVTPVSGGGTGRTAVSNGAILLGTTTPQSLGQLTAGSAGTVLQSNGSRPVYVSTSTLFSNASAASSGLLTSTDWSTFNGKQPALVIGADGKYMQASSTAAGGYTWTTVSGSDCTNNCPFTGYISINTTTPTANLDVVGDGTKTYNLKTSGSYTTQTDLGIANYITGTYDPATNDNFGVSQFYGTYNQLNLNGTHTRFLDIANWNEINVNGIANYSYLYGAGYSILQNVQSTATQATLLDLQYQAQSTLARVGTVVGLEIDPPYITPGGTLGGGTNYGIQINSQCATDSTSTPTGRFCYGISQNSSNDRNSFAGHVTIGSATTTSELYVQGFNNPTNDVLTIASSSNQIILRVTAARTVIFPILTASKFLCLGSSSEATTTCPTLAVANGGTGQTSYTDGQLLIGNTTGNTLAAATLTGTANQITVTNGHGSITLALPQNIDTGAAVTFGSLTTTDLIGNGTAPTIATSTGVGTGAGTSKSITGHDLAGFVNVKTGTSPSTNATIVTITFSAAKSVAPYCQVTKASSDASIVWATTTTTTLLIKSNGTALTGATNYAWYYHCDQ